MAGSWKLKCSLVEKTMKSMGLIGGMSWYSSLEYSRLINEVVTQKLGALHSAPVFLYSLDFL